LAVVSLGGFGERTIMVLIFAAKHESRIAFLDVFNTIIRSMETHLAHLCVYRVETQVKLAIFVTDRIM
jgi:hypothetical protein